MSTKFDLGKLVSTACVHQMMIENPEFNKFVNESFMKYILCDWGDTCEDDSKQNDESVEKGERILAVYKKDEWTIWIITEWDRSSTTILFPEEY